MLSARLSVCLGVGDLGTDLSCEEPTLRQELLVWCDIGSYRSSGSEREAHWQEMVGSNSITIIKVKQQGLGNGKDDKVVAALANKARLESE